MYIYSVGRTSIVCADTGLILSFGTACLVRCRISLDPWYWNISTRPPQPPLSLCSSIPLCLYPVLSSRPRHVPPSRSGRCVRRCPSITSSNSAPLTLTPRLASARPLLRSKLRCHTTHHSYRTNNLNLNPNVNLALAGCLARSRKSVRNRSTLMIIPSVPTPRRSSARHKHLRLIPSPHTGRRFG